MPAPIKLELYDGDSPVLMTIRVSAAGYEALHRLAAAWGLKDAAAYPAACVEMLRAEQIFELVRERGTLMAPGAKICQAMQSPEAQA